MSCPACASADVAELLNVGDMPILCNQLCATEQAARGVDLGRIELGFCRSCGHVFNRVFDASAVNYSAEYENSLHCSSTFQSYADDLVKELVARYDLHGKRIMELGCGQGDFLRSLCAAGDNEGIGFDPSYAGGVEDPRVTIRPVSFADIDGSYDVDFVCCRHVLEHIEEPRRLLEALVAKLQPGTTVFFEVPNALFTLRDGGIWDIIYEHCGYFSPSSLRRVFELAGLGVDAVEEVFNGQFLVVHARVGGAPAAPTPVDPGLEDLANGFANTYREKVTYWRDLLERADSDGERVVAWGAGSKGNTFLNLVGPKVQAIVDINPKKRGKFVAGTGQPIVAPEQLRDTPPSTVVIMNAVYEKEIADTLAGLDIRARLLVA